MTGVTHITECGLPGIKRIPYGLHACHFYPTREALVEAVVPYFLKGLSQNERCLWITAPPLPAMEAIASLRAAWHGADQAMEKGALRVVDYDDWYVQSSQVKSGLLDAWLEEEKRALAAGYEGLRITGNTAFLHSAQWRSFMEYERAVTARFAGRRIIALCSYALDLCSPSQVKEVMRAHGCTFDRVDAGWQVVDSQSM